VGLLLDANKMWKLVKTEEKVVNIAFAWKLKVFMPVDSCKLCVKSLSTPINKTFNITAVHSYRCKIAISFRLGGKTLVLYGFGKLLPSTFINLTCVCLS
jgi:hypothetical protein